MAASDERADVLAYRLQTAAALGMDVEDACAAKLTKNAATYPVETSRGVSTKYADLSSVD